MLICIAICTRERPRLLRNCLASIAALTPVSGVSTQVLVVENTTEPECTEIIEQAFPDDRALHVHEPRLGLVCARNRALDEADALGAEWMAFFDDDEVVDPDWLTTMVRAIEEFHPGSSILTGPRWKIRTRGASPYLPVQYGFPEHGDKITAAQTNNVLIHRSIFGADGASERFDLAFNLSGSEDTEFFMRLARNGVDIRYVPDAIAYEKLASDRVTLGYHLARIREYQTNAGRIRRTFMSPTRALASDMLKLNRALVCTIAYTLAAAVVVVLDRDLARRCAGLALQQTARIAGLVDGIRGVTPKGYAKVTGKS